MHVRRIKDLIGIAQIAVVKAQLAGRGVIIKIGIVDPGISNIALVIFVIIIAVIFGRIGIAGIAVPTIFFLVLRFARRIAVTAGRAELGITGLQEKGHQQSG